MYLFKKHLTTFVIYPIVFCCLFKIINFIPLFFFVRFEIASCRFHCIVVQRYNYWSSCCVEIWPCGDKSGIFTAPYDALYSISCTLMSDPSNSVWLAMVKNGQKISVLYSGAKTYPQSAQTLNLILNKGDRIWIQNHSKDIVAKMPDLKMFNVFSGHLIRDL